MATTDPLYCIPGLSASADLSAKQFHFVKMSGDGTVTVCAAVTDKPIGILQNNPASGEAATVAAFGVSKVKADAALTAGESVGTSADAQCQPVVVGTETTVYNVGTVTQGAGSGEIGTIAFNCLGASRAA